MPVLRPLRRFSPPAATALGAAFLAALVTAAFWPLLTGDRALYFGDIGLYFLPQLAFQRRELLAGRIPLWNPDLLCGTPFVGNPQAWPLYPSSLLLYGLPAPHAIGVLGGVHIALAAVGTLLFLRRRGRSVGAGMLGAVAFALGGAFVSKLQFPNMVQAAAFLPWLLWATDRVIGHTATRRTAIGRAATLGTLVGLALLAAHAQMFLMQAYLCLAWVLWRLCPLPTQTRRSAAALLIAAVVLGSLLAAPQILPVAGVARISVRPNLTLVKASRFALPPEAVLTAFVAPNFYGNPARGDFIGRGNFWETCAYAGLLPFGLALAAAARCFRRDDEVRFWTLAGVAALWLALGRIGGLYSAAFYVLPGLRLFHDPARWLQVAAFALACLAAHGLDGATARLSSPIRAAAVLAVMGLTLLDLLPFTRALNPTVAASVFERPPPAAKQLASLPPGRVYHADDDRVWRRFVRYRSYLPGDTSEVRDFLNTLGPNLPLLYDLPQAGGYEPVRGAAINVLLARLSSATRTGDADVSRRLRALSVCYVLAYRPRPLRAVRSARVVQIGDTWIETLLDPAPRAALWHTWRAAASPADALRMVREPNWDGVPLVAGISFAPPAPRAATSGALRVRALGPDRLVVDLPRGSVGLVTLADVNAPGWEARADGQPVPIRTVNGAFRGVVLTRPAGQVEFRYAPTLFRVGLYLCGWGTGILAAVAGFRFSPLPRPLPRSGRGETEGERLRHRAHPKATLPPLSRFGGGAGGGGWLLQPKEEPAPETRKQDPDGTPRSDIRLWQI